MTINIQRNCQAYLASILIFIISSSLILGQAMLNTAAELTPLEKLDELRTRKPNSTSAPPNPQPLKLPKEVTPSTPSTSSQPTRPTSRPQSTPSTSSQPTTRRSSSYTNGHSALPRKLTFKQLNFGVVEFGILAPNDFQAEDRYFDLYKFKGNKNQPILIELVGSADQRTSNNLSLVPYLFLLDPKGRVIANTGSTEANREILMFDRLPSDGTYTIAVTSKKPKDIGRYSLALKQDRTSYILDRSGELTNDSSTLKQDGSRFDVFELQGKQNQLVNIRLESVNEQFYPCVFLVNSKKEIIAWKYTKNANSVLIDNARLPKDATYYIVVNSVNPKDRGNYRLTVY